MNTTQRNGIMQRWNVIQHELMPELRDEVGALTAKLAQVVHTLEWVRIEEFVSSSWGGYGRPEHDRGMLANAFVAKAILGISTTAGLIERLAMDRALKRICGFSMWRKLPSEATFSRAFAEFAEAGLAERTHAALVKETLGEQLIGHISRDGTAIESREKPAKRAKVSEPAVTKKRGRPCKGEIREAKLGKLEQQRGKPLAELLEELPRECDRGSKCNAQGYKNSWNGYKLHIDTTDCGIPVSALLSSASMHDSLAAMPLSLMTAERVTNCYDLMDAAYCSSVLRDHSRSLGHVPLIDHNPRKGEKIEFTPSEAQRYKERSQAERINARLKDDYGGRYVRVRGNAKVMSHLMFGMLALTAEQLMRLLT
ncbi:transposase DDE domain protein [Ferrovum sp. JA12]|uniref:IS5/IS1182 family transposase n=1 Tax=Ferrovum sp. JA12 TaxID=1356299 RepID=UPI0007028DB1|nr:IS5/IS1182 family transposase [Ferrovum sp. JA12]KRH78829.1 transposase DDE domain protein [Ferrovum sp. JA12]KRH79476.1 transposase DDE domain protein [Ferrovum sp. JA12]